MPDKLEKLKHILALANEDYLKYPDFLKFLSVMKVVLEEIRTDTKKYAKSEIVQFTDTLNALIDSVKVESSKQKGIKGDVDELKSQISALSEAVRAIPEPEVCDHEDIDQEALTESILSKIPKVDPYELDIEKLIAELNELPDDDSLKIDASRIKNLPKGNQQFGGGGIRKISLLNDVSIVNPTNAQVLKYNSTTKLWENGTDSGGGGGGAVDSVFGRTGVVTAQSGDYTTAIVADSSNKRYVTDAQLTVLGNTSGTNTGDQTSIVGITGTLAEFNTALTGADFATLAGSETFTNKTLTSPVINSATIGTSLVPTTNDGAALGSTANSFSDLFLATGAVLNIGNGNWVATHSSGVLTVGTGDLRVTTAGTNATSVVTLNGTQTLLNKRLTAPQVAAMQYTGEIFNFLAPTEELLTLNGVSTAVNEFTISNAATGTNPILEATGNDTNIGITLKPKGTGTVAITGSLIPSTNDGAALGTTANSFSDLFLASGGVINFNSGNATITHSTGVLTSNVPFQMPYIGVGGTPNTSTGLLVSGTGYTSNLIAATGSLSPTTGTNATLYRIAGTIVEASSGTHNLMSAMFLGTTTVTGGSATVNNTAGLYIEGAMTATVVGENYAIWSDDGINRFDGDVRIGGALDHNGTTVGFYGVTPVVRSSAYTVTNGVTDRTYDANATSVDELADVLATLIADLKLTGIIA